jgi:hypothetical protein
VGLYYVRKRYLASNYANSGCSLHKVEPFAEDATFFMTASISAYPGRTCGRQLLKQPWPLVLRRVGFNLSDIGNTYIEDSIWISIKRYVYSNLLAGK